MTATDTAHDALIEVLSLTRQEHENGVVVYRNHLGERHRIHGPAIEFPDGDACWYINGMRLYEEEQFNEYVKKMKLGQQK